MSDKTVRFADPTLQSGFTQIPNAILREATLSVQARLAFAMLASFAWEDESCFPGQEKVAAMLGVSDRSLRGYIGELKAAGAVEVERRGLGKTNRYVLLPSALTGSLLPLRTGSVVPGKKTKVEEDSEEEAAGRSASSSSPTGKKDWRAVWAVYLDLMKPRRKEPDEGQRRVMTDALKVASVEECCEAVEKCAASDFHMKRGQYAKRKGGRYNQLSRILKGRRGKESTRERIEWWLDLEVETADVIDLNAEAEEMQRLQEADEA